MSKKMFETRYSASKSCSKGKKVSDYFTVLKSAYTLNINEYLKYLKYFVKSCIRVKFFRKSLCFFVQYNLLKLELISIL
jgi:hypothetical protein